MARTDGKARRERRFNIGLFWEKPSYDYIYGVLEYLHKRQLHWDFHDAVAEPNRRGMLQKKVALDGIILDSAVRMAERIGEGARPLPMVDVNPNPDPGVRKQRAVYPLRTNPRYVHLFPDEKTIGASVADYFMARGFVHFAFFGMECYFFSRLRRDGFVSQLAEHEFQPAVFSNVKETWEKMSSPAWEKARERWIAALPKPVAVMCAMDIRARQLIRQCLRVGIRIPQDVAVCGVDNQVEYCEMDTPTLSSVPLNRRQAGYEAARTLHSMLQGTKPTASELRIAPLPVVTRNSSDVYAVEDEDVAEALRFIYGNCSRPLTVEQVVAAVVISRKSLERRFSSVQGRTIQNEIWRAHVERARHLLMTSNGDMPAVARGAGFRNAERLSVVFRREMKKTPTAYRDTYGAK